MYTALYFENGKIIEQPLGDTYGEARRTVRGLSLCHGYVELLRLGEHALGYEDGHLID